MRPAQKAPENFFVCTFPSSRAMYFNEAGAKSAGKRAASEEAHNLSSVLQ